MTAADRQRVRQAVDLACRREVAAAGIDVDVFPRRQRFCEGLTEAHTRCPYPAVRGGFCGNHQGQRVAA